MEWIDEAAGIAWRAEYQSFDQRKDDVYYTVIASRGGVRTGWVVRIGIEWAGDDWRTAEFGPRLERLVREAASAVGWTDPPPGGGTARNAFPSL
ncbi:hypothetical protein ACFQO7_34135 [Catellatospora aurea]|uniref:Uncharacterized protein n=1 Tax=Catellatospora aurea TaxID=1337874 RepID=A0ABW2H6J5_9ACTN